MAFDMVSERKGYESMNKEDSIQLLKECSTGTKMALGSIDHVLAATENNELKSLLEDYKKAHSEINGKLDQMLTKYDEEAKEPSTVSKLFANFTAGMKLALDNSEHEIARLMMDGCNMGIQSVSEYINEYKEASQDCQDIADKLVKTEQRFMDDLRKFL